MNNNQFVKAYSIKEVSKKINTPSGTIRQWERDLNGLLTIPRTKQGARYYTDKEIAILEKVKAMRDQNMHKGLIRTLLEKHLNQSSEPASESFERTNEGSIEHALEPVNDNTLSIQENQIEEMNLRMEAFKQELLREIKNEMMYNKNEMMDEFKKELVNHSLHTLQGVSKSIQRSNDKRKAEVQVLSETINQVSERTSEGFETISSTISDYSKGTSERFETLSTSISDYSKGTSEQFERLRKRIAKASEGTYEQLTKQIDKTLKSSSTGNQKSLNQVTQSIGDVRSQLDEFSKTVGNDQQQIIQSIRELKESTAEIQQREEMFQELVASYREVAAAKNKTWWKFWQ